MSYSYDLGLDRSGNNNHWSVNNMTISDQMLDTPTNNFATMNPLANGEIDAIINSQTGRCAISEGNLETKWTAVGSAKTYATLMPTNGKWYWEFYIDVLAESTRGYVGLGEFEDMDIGSSGQSGDSNYQMGVGNYSRLQAYGNEFDNTYSTPAQGDVWSFAVDWEGTSSKFWYRRNGGSWEGGGNPATGATPTKTYSKTITNASMCPYHGTGSGSSSNVSTIVHNFGQDSSFAGNKTAQGNQDGNDIGDFYYTPPTGFLALCTSNLPDVDIIPSEHFQAIDYIGNGNSTQTLTTTFEPDFIWNKTDDYHHRIYDRVRGLTKQLYTNITGEEDKYTDFGQPTATSSTSLTFGQGTDSGNLINASSADGIFWLWNADSTTSGTTTGSGTGKAYSARYNTDAGFSIIKYGGNGTAGHTIPHHLGAVPQAIFVKNLTVMSWDVYFEATGNTKNFQLDNESLSTNSTKWNNTSPTSSVFTVGTSNGVNRFTSGNNDQYMAYCFRSIDGYSKIGQQYSGNANADGTFIYTGFKPAFVMVKRLTSSEGWYIRDSARDLYNPTGEAIIANSSGHDYNNCSSSGNTCVDLLSNGFKQRGTDTSHNSAHDFVYVAFAETPFKYSNAQ